MLRGKVEGEMVLLSLSSNVKESPEDKQASAPCVRGSTFTWGTIFSVKSGQVPGFSGGVRIFRYTSVTEYSDPPENPGTGPDFTEKMGPLHK